MVSFRLQPSLSLNSLLKVRPKYTHMNYTFRPSTTEFEQSTHFDHLPDDDSDEEGLMDDEMDLDPGLIKITSHNANNLTSDQPFLVFQQCLMQLVSLINFNKTCNKCAADVILAKTIIGSALHLKWVSQFYLLHL